MSQELHWKSAPDTRMLTAEDFAPSNETTVYWLGSGGIFINCRGTLLMFDPVLGYKEENPELSEAGFPYLQPPPIAPADVPRLDAVIYTHADYDHMTPGSALGLVHTGAVYHGTHFVAGYLKDFGVPEDKIVGHDIHTKFTVGNVEFTLTPALHQWIHPEGWCYALEDCCGFILDTPDGRIWVPGDSTLMDEHLTIKDENIDLMFLDISNDPFHFGLDNAIMLANLVKPADLILYHYGTYLAPTKKAFCGDPAVLVGRIEDESRICDLGAGVPYVLHKKERYNSTRVPPAGSAGGIFLLMERCREIICVL